MIPVWLTALSIASVSFGAACAAVVIIDELRYPQRMWIMNVVWPVTALFGTAWVAWQYFNYGRLSGRQRRKEPMNGSPDMNRRVPFRATVTAGTLHCGGGCTLGDILAEWLVFTFPSVAVAFGWRSVFSQRIFAAWIVDYLAAYAFGIVFQYFTIAPMRSLSFRQGILAAIKADTLSLTAWQLGMYGFMALAYFFFFRSLLGVRLTPVRVEFWFMMQIAMLFGFMTSYPVNWWLLRSGIKEAM